VISVGCFAAGSLRAAHQPTSITTAIQDSAHFVTYATGTRQP
jgi:hypothetical protein